MLNQQTKIAKGLIDANRLNEAEQILVRLKNKFSIFELARLKRIQGRNREAEQLYLKALSVQPEIKYPIESDINIELGRIYSGFGKIEDAETRYKKGLDRISIDKNIYGELGELYLNSRLYKEAKESLEKSIKIFPNDIRANLNLAIVYRKMGQDDATKGILNKLLLQKEVKGNKFIYNKVLNEYEIIMRRQYLESKPREMRVTITNKCNIGCRYCDIWKDTSWQLPEERMKEIMNSFAYMENMYWLGGETFLYKGFEEVLEEGSKYANLNQTILTNGLLLNERILDKISKANISLLIAIDAGKKETYEYLRRGANWDTLCKKLELIKEVNKKTNKKIRTIFNAVISKSNYKEMFEMLEMAHKYDFNEIRFMSILGNSDENIWLNNDIIAIKYIEEIMPLVETRAKEYNIRVENKVFGSSKYDKNSKKSLKSSEIIRKDALKYKNGYYKNINVKFVKNNNYSLISTNEKTMKCIFPWKQVVIDSKGPMRMCASCNDWLGDSANQTIQEYWNCENMQFFRKKFGEMYSCVHDNNLAGGNPGGPCVLPPVMCIAT